MNTIMDTFINPKYLDHTILSTFEHDYTSREIVNETGRYLQMLQSEEMDMNGLRVVILIPQAISLVSVIFAVNTLGGTAVPLGMQYRQDDLIAVLNVVKPHYVFTAMEHNGISFSEIVRSWQHQSSSMQCTIFESKDGTYWDKHSYEGEYAPKEDVARQIIFFTSGSTGVPKGIVIDHETLKGNLDIYSRMMNIKSEDQLFNLPPMSSMIGFSGFLSALHGGARFAVPDLFDLPKMAELMKRVGCNKLVSTPSVMKALYAITQHLEPRIFKRLEACYLSGELMSEGIVQQFPLADKAKFVGVYGITEAGGVMSCNLREKLEWEVDQAVRVTVLEENGSQELLVKSPSLFKCYFNLPVLTLEMMTENGWFRTGDLVEVTANKKIVLVGRKKDLIKKGGQQVVPGEIEQILLLHPNVKQAVVLGVPHAIYGEQVVAFTVLHDELLVNELYSFCANKIARYKVPDVIEVVSEIPIMQAKVDKITLRNQFLAKKGQN